MAIKSADQGNAEAQYQFGQLKLRGSGVSHDIDKAVEWFYKSSLKGNTDA
jgi:TPR repeat protein